MKRKRPPDEPESLESMIDRIAVPEIGQPGGSADREYERRRASRRARIRERYGLVGSLVNGLRDDPDHVLAWRQGAEGEVATANSLRIDLQGSEVAVLHDRRIASRGRWNIDHLTVGPGGVTVIDSKSSRGRVQLTTMGVMNKREVLLVNGRDRTSQLDAVERQIDRVWRSLDRAGWEVSVLGALCYPFMHRPWLYYADARDGLIRVDDPAHIARFANRAGALSSDDIVLITQLLERAFPPAAAA